MFPPLDDSKIQPMEKVLSGKQLVSGNNVTHVSSFTAVMKTRHKKSMRNKKSSWKYRLKVRKNELSVIFLSFSKFKEWLTRLRSARSEMKLLSRARFYDLVNFLTAGTSFNERSAFIVAEILRTTNCF